MTNMTPRVYDLIQKEIKMKECSDAIKELLDAMRLVNVPSAVEHYVGKLHMLTDDADPKVRIHVEEEIYAARKRVGSLAVSQVGASSVTSYDRIQELADKDVATLRLKNESYGDSWKRRGGVGAFMMLARKWDRIENHANGKGYDIFEACKDQDVLDDISDLRCYLLLVEGELLGR